MLKVINNDLLTILLQNFFIKTCACVCTKFASSMGLFKYTYNSNTKKMKVGVSNESWSSTENRKKIFIAINFLTTYL